MRTSSICLALLVGAAGGCRTRLLDPQAASRDMAAGPAAWPSYQHDSAHSGRSPFVGPARPKRKWIFAATAHAVLPVIGADGTIYVAADQQLHALNPDGSQRWSAGPIDVTAHVAIGSDGTLYAGATDGKLYAFTADGTPKWTVAAGDVVGGATVGADGTIYAASQDQHVYAVNPEGSLRWSFAMDDGGFWPPALAADGTLYVGTWRNYSTPGLIAGHLYALNPDGSLKWTYVANGVVYTPAVGADGTIFVRTGGATLNAIDPGGHEKWRTPVDIYMRSTPALAADGTVYIGTGQFDLSAIDGATGAIEWVFSRDICNECSPTIGGDGTIYISGFEQSFYAIAPDGSERWTFDSGDSARGNVAVDDAIAIGGDGTLYQGAQGGGLYAVGDASR